MKNFFCLIALFLFSAKTFAQEGLLPVRIMATPKTPATQFIGTDTFGWEFVTANNELRKQKDGRTLVYKNISLGQISRVDILNPLQVVVFYKKFNTVVLLDNQLNATNIINFNELNFPILPEAAGLSGQNRLWIYDQNTQQTGLFDISKNTFKTLTPPSNDGIVWYQNDYNFFYWTDSSNKLFCVNIFGKVNSLGTVPEFDSAQLLSSNALLICKNGVISLYEISAEKSTPVNVVEKSFAAFYYKEGILSIFTNSEIIQYKISLPK